MCFTNVGKGLKNQAETLENSPYQNVSTSVYLNRKLCDGNVFFLLFLCCDTKEGSARTTLRKIHTECSVRTLALSLFI